MMDDHKKPDGMTRREFIKTSALGAVGSAVLTAVPGAVSAAGHLPGDALDHKRKQWLSFVVNGKPVRLFLEPRTTLAEALRDHLGLTGAKISCNRGQCGACTVLVNGKAVYSCHMLALDAADQDVTTIEGLADGEELHPLQKAFKESDGMQCGFCTPGQVMAAHALLLKHPHPTKEQILEGMSGNLCRCSAYPKIIESVQRAAG